MTQSTFDPMSCPHCVAMQKTAKVIVATEPCDLCDGEDGPAIARIKMKEYDGSSSTVNVCVQCRDDQHDETVKVLKLYVQGNG